MQKAGKKCRDIKFFSRKNDGIVVVHTKESHMYAEILEERSSVYQYEAGKALDPVKMKLLNRVDIRGDYLKTSWESDFYISNSDGTISIREIAAENSLSSRAEVEKLELSRRYWTDLCGVNDWKVVIMRGGKESCS